MYQKKKKNCVLVIVLCLNRQPFFGGGGAPKGSRYPADWVFHRRKGVSLMNGPLIPDGLFNMLGVLPPQLTVATGRKKEKKKRQSDANCPCYINNLISSQQVEHICKAEVQEVKVKVVCILHINITRNNNF